MAITLTPGMTFEFAYVVPENKTVPHLFPEFDEGQVMPKVLATGFMVGLFEFACIRFINNHIDWPKQQTGRRSRLWIVPIMIVFLSTRQSWIPYIFIDLD